jgi:hypothetical protein
MDCAFDARKQSIQNVQLLGSAETVPRQVSMERVGKRWMGTTSQKPGGGGEGRVKEWGEGRAGWNISE